MEPTLGCGQKPAFQTADSSEPRERSEPMAETTATSYSNCEHIDNGWCLVCVSDLSRQLAAAEVVVIAAIEIDNLRPPIITAYKRGTSERTDISIAMDALSESLFDYDKKYSTERTNG